MSFPKDQKVIDLMLAIPSEDRSDWYEFMRPLWMDKESKNMFKMPAQYMFKNIPELEKSDDYTAFTVAEMDKYNIEQAMLGLAANEDVSHQAIKRYPDRFFLSCEANPNDGMDEVRRIEALHKEHKIKAVTAFPSGLCPQVPVNDKKWYPIYAKLVELDIPFCPCMGVPGPRLPAAPQHVELLDEVCWFFPELKIVTRHGCEPWTAMAVKLMLKYPNLHYMTSAFAPKHYPEDIIHFANTRGTDKILYAGYYPMGISLERTFADMPKVPFREHVWPKFLYENAKRVFKL
jgi:predicted TIM-barrel fold metal-dependent hydrolase